MVSVKREGYRLYRGMGVSQNWGYHFGCPYNKDYSILGSILGFPYFGKVPYRWRVEGLGLSYCWILISVGPPKTKRGPGRKKESSKHMGGLGDLMALIETSTQRAQYPLIKVYTLKGTRAPNMMNAIFLTQEELGSLGKGAGVLQL